MKPLKPLRPMTKHTYAEYKGIEVEGDDEKGFLMENYTWQSAYDTFFNSKSNGDIDEIV